MNGFVQVVRHPLSRLRGMVRARTRWRAWRSRRALQAAAVPASPADFGAWVSRANGRQLGAVPDDWRGRDDVLIDTPASVCVVLHVFYAELLPELFDRLRRIPVAYDLLITNAAMPAIDLPDDLGLVRSIRMFEVENRGRDILPLVHLVNGGFLDPYHVVLKIHTKRSEWRSSHDTLTGTGTEWRHDLLDSVLGQPDEIAAILSAFAEQPGLGILADDSSILGPEFWGDNRATVKTLLRRVELVLDEKRLRFAAGSMYWVRGFVLQGLRALNLSAEDFEPEEGQVNATTAHALERAIGVLAGEAGLSLVGRSALSKPKNRESYKTLERAGLDARARIVPFYLPQFHPTPENNRWWGQGFTEWTNVTAARPVYTGHYQPRLPRDLGFYDLRLDEIREAQLSLASTHGVAAFMYYYYWFAGRRLLDAPIQALLQSEIAQPFCIMWANENWTRRWDGRDADVLIGQDYDRVPTTQFIEDILPLLADNRYITIHGRKLIAIYRPGQIANLEDVLAGWREQALAAGVGDLFILNVDFYPEGPRSHEALATVGLDGSLGFPPHNHHWERLPADALGIDPRFRGNILDYSALAGAAEADLRSGLDATYFPGVMVSFDNTPRRQWASDLWYGSNPYTFRRWLAAAVEAVMDRSPDERLVFVNAWNEWAESAILEPTDRFGRTFLLAVRDAVLGGSPTPAFSAIDDAVATSRKS